MLNSASKIITSEQLPPSNAVPPPDISPTLYIAG